MKHCPVNLPSVCACSGHRVTRELLMRFLGITVAAVLWLGCIHPAASQTAAAAAAEFQSIDAFVRSMPHAQVSDSVEGDLTGKGRKDWAGLLLFEDANETQLFVLERLASGSYQIAAKSQTRTGAWGTGNFMFQGLAIKNQSLFVDFSYHYGTYRCDGHVVSQFKRYQNTWRMIGVKSEEACDCTGTKVVSDTNLLTGDANVIKTVNGKRSSSRLKAPPRLILLSDFVDGWDLMSMHERDPVCQPCPIADEPR